MRGDLALSAKEVIFCLTTLPEEESNTDLSRCSTTVRWISICGFFTLAYAYTLQQGEDPVKIQYDVPKTRPHFLFWLQKTEFAVFPSVKTRHTLYKAIMTSFKIYCLCRLHEKNKEIRWLHVTNARMVPFCMCWNNLIYRVR